MRSAWTTSKGTRSCIMHAEWDSFALTCSRCEGDHAASNCRMKRFPRTTTTATKRNYLPTYPYARDEVRTNPNYNNNNNSTVTPNNNNKNNWKKDEKYFKNKYLSPRSPTRTPRTRTRRPLGQQDLKKNWTQTRLCFIYLSLSSGRRTKNVDLQQQQSQQDKQQQQQRAFGRDLED